MDEPEEPFVQYRYGPGWTVTEVSPKQCPKGHQLGPNRALAGFAREDGKEYRTYHCVPCMDAGVDTTMRFRVLPPRADGPW